MWIVAEELQVSNMQDIFFSFCLYILQQSQHYYLSICLWQYFTLTHITDVGYKILLSILRELKIFVVTIIGHFDSRF